MMFINFVIKSLFQCLYYKSWMLRMVRYGLDGIPGLPRRKVRTEGQQKRISSV